MNNRTLSSELEIDLIQVMKDLLLQWKPIIAVMLIFGLITPGVMYVKGMRDYNAAIENHRDLQEKMNSAKNGEGVDNSELYEELTDAEKVAVDSAILKVETYNRRKDYADHSLLMNLDPSKKRTVELTYTISGSAEYLNTVTDMYVSSIKDNTFTENMVKSFNKMLKKDTSVRYVSELISASTSGGPSGSATKGKVSFYVTIILPNEKIKAEDVADTVKSYLNSRVAYVTSTIGAHQLSFVNYEEKVSDDQELLTRQSDTKAGILTAKSEIYTLTDAFNDNQKQIFSTETDMKLEEKFNLDTDDDGIMDAMDLNENGIDDEQEELYNLDTDDDGKPDALDLNENGIDDTLEMETELTKPGFSKKYAALGLLIGLVVYGGIYLLLLIFVPVIRSGLELSDMLGIKSFGCLHSETKRMGFFCSRWMFNLLYHKDKSTDELLSDTVERIDVFAKYHEIGALTLISADAESADMVARIKEKLDAAGISTSAVDLWDGEKVTDLAEESMSGNDNYIICMMPRATRIADIDKLLSVASEYDKKVVGSVAV